jgi:ComF family protein
MLKKLLKLFFPEVCLGCSNILINNEKTICISCRHNVSLTNNLYHFDNECFKKFYGRIPLEFASAMLFYHKKGITQQLIHQLKYKNHQEIGTLLGEWYAADLSKNEILQTVDYIIPVPLHKKRFKERGYNQVDTFCKAIAKGIQKPYEAQLLRRNTYAKSQSKMNLINRNTVSEKTFEIKFSTQHNGKHFLLIDDVLTTGATLEACGKEILKIPNAKLSIITIALSQS